MNKSESITELAKGLAKAQAAFPPILKDKTVKVRTKAGGEYTFHYADADTIHKAVREPLEKNDLAFTHLVNDGQLVTALIHASGEWVESIMPLPESIVSYQEYGSALTYLKRYALSAILGISTEEDDDGNIVDQNQYEVAPEKPWYNDFEKNKQWFIDQIDQGKSPDDLIQKLTEKYRVNKKIRTKIAELRGGQP